MNVGCVCVWKRVHACVSACSMRIRRLYVSRPMYLRGWVWVQVHPPFTHMAAHTSVSLCPSVLASVLVCVLYVSLSVWGSVHLELLFVNTCIYTCQL